MFHYVGVFYFNTHPNPQSASRMVEFTVLDVTPVPLTAKLAAAVLRRKKEKRRGKKRGSTEYVRPEMEVPAGRSGASVASGVSGASSKRRVLSGPADAAVLGPRSLSVMDDTEEAILVHGAGAGAGAGAAGADGASVGGGSARRGKGTRAKAGKAGPGGGAGWLHGGPMPSSAASVGTSLFSFAASKMTGMTGRSGFSATTVTGGPKGKYLLAEVEVARTSDLGASSLTLVCVGCRAEPLTSVVYGLCVILHSSYLLPPMKILRSPYLLHCTGVNDTRFTVVSHLGHLLKAGDLVMGYDMSRAVFADVDPGMKLELFPDVVLVKKVFQRDASRKRAWKLKKLTTSDGAGKGGAGTGGDLEEQQYEEFLQEVERDKKLRANISVFKGEFVLVCAGGEGTCDYDSAVHTQLLYASCVHRGCSFRSFRPCLQHASSLPFTSPLPLPCSDVISVPWRS